MTTVEGLTLLVMAVAAGTPGVIAAMGSKRNNDKLNELHVSLDGRLTQFFAAQADALQEIARANQKNRAYGRTTGSGGNFRIATSTADVGELKCCF